MDSLSENFHAILHLPILHHQYKKTRTQSGKREKFIPAVQSARHFFELQCSTGRRKVMMSLETVVTHIEDREPENKLVTHSYIERSNQTSSLLLLVEEFVCLKCSM